MQDLVFREGEAFPSLLPSIIVRLKTHGNHNSADSGFSELPSRVMPSQSRAFAFNLPAFQSLTEIGTTRAVIFKFCKPKEWSRTKIPCFANRSFFGKHLILKSSDRKERRLDLSAVIVRSLSIKTLVMKRLNCVYPRRTEIGCRRAIWTCKFKSSNLALWQPDDAYR